MLLLNVLSAIDEDGTFGEKFTAFFKDLWAKLSDGAMWGNALLRIVGIVLLIVVGHFAIKLVLKILERVLNINKKRRDPSVNRFIYSVVSVTLKGLLVITVIYAIGIPITGLSTVLSSAILAIGLSLQDTVANFAAGVQILSTRPFATGDWVEIDGASGTVVDIDMLSTTLKTSTGQKVFIPNKIIVNTKKTNYNAYPTRQSRLDIAFPEEAKIDKIREGVLAIVTSDPRVLSEPKPQFVISGFENNQINISFRFWATTGDFWSTRFELNEKITKFLQDNHYVFSYYKHSVVNLPANE